MPHYAPNKRHGLSRTPIHNCWQEIFQRCENPNDEGFKNYGGRGITICDRWRTFENFLEDMGHRPSPTHSLERLDNNGPYSKENCKWATRIEQNNNKRNNIDMGGISLAEFCRRHGRNYMTMYKRIVIRRWSPERALNQPLRSHQ